MTHQPSLRHITYIWSAQVSAVNSLTYWLCEHRLFLLTILRLNFVHTYKIIIYATINQEKPLLVSSVNRLQMYAPVYKSKVAT